jgi:hypothetical protein
MEIKVKLVVESVNTTLSALYIDGDFECWVLEDAEQEEKIEGITRIPAGRYPIGVRKNSPMAKRYDDKFENIDHRGMLWLRGVPDYTYVYIHIGNNHENTEGCLLVGDGVGRDSFGVASTITQSTNAYLRIYPMIMDAIDRQEPVFISVERGEKSSDQQSYINGFVAGNQAQLRVLERMIGTTSADEGNVKAFELMALESWKKENKQ